MCTVRHTKKTTFMTYSLVPNEKELNRSRAILGTVRTGLLPTYNMLPFGIWTSYLDILIN